MLEGLKRWISGTAPPLAHASLAGGQEVAAWAVQHQGDCRVVKDEGFVVDGRSGAIEWRMEWGPPQRNYIVGKELRLRAELGLPGDLQALVLNRPLAQSLEQALFDQYVEGVQTRIDSETPPEMRWLVMFPKLPAADMHGLHDRFVAAASARAWVAAWLRGPLAQALQDHAPATEVPLVLTISRGRLSLRAPMAQPEAGELDSWLALFDVAAQQARRVADESPEAALVSAPASVWGSTTAGSEPPR
jgi:hypothetical protein